MVAVLNIDMRWLELEIRSPGLVCEVVSVSNLGVSVNEKETVFVEVWYSMKSRAVCTTNPIL